MAWLRTVGVCWWLNKNRALNPDFTGIWLSGFYQSGDASRRPYSSEAVISASDSWLNQLISLNSNRLCSINVIKSLFVLSGGVGGRTGEIKGIPQALLEALLPFSTNSKHSAENISFQVIIFNFSWPAALGDISCGDVSPLRWHFSSAAQSF